MKRLPPRTYKANPRAEQKVLPMGVQHPAKMSVPLCRDLFLRYTLPGQTVLDPFGGRGTSLIGCTLGRNVILNELEPHFVAYQRENYAHLQAHTLPGMPLGEATILQGDSRHLPLPSAACDRIASSPPYAEALTYQQAGAGGEHWELLRAGYAPDQIAEMRRAGDPRVTQTRRDAGYSRSPENIGNLKNTNYAPDAAITSPPYVDARGDWPTPEGAENIRYGATEGQIGGLAHGDVAAAISSPPYLDAREGSPRNPSSVPDDQHIGDSQRAVTAREMYGTSAGQIGQMPVGDVAAVVSSPPYGDLADRNRSEEPYAQAHPERESSYGTHAPNRHVDGYGETPGQIGSLHHAGVDDACVSSPPFADCLTTAAEQKREWVRANGKPQGFGGSTFTDYGHSEGQIGALPHGGVDHAAVTSPPYEASLSGDSEAQRQRKADRYARGEFQAMRPDVYTSATNNGSKGFFGGYGETEGQIGDEQGETYASAMLAVLRECFRVVRPGGVLVLVTGNYVRGGAIVDLAADTIKLAQAAGWMPWERWEHRKASVSFWRRLHFQQAVRENREPQVVTHEDVLVFCKGLRPAWEFAELPPTTAAPAELTAKPEPQAQPLPLFAEAADVAG